MKGKELAKELGILFAGALVKNAPGIVDRIAEKKEEKNFFEDNKSWIFIIILSIFVTHLDYFNMFENAILNSIINIIFGVIVLILLWLFFCEEKNIFKNNKSNFIKAVIISLIILGIINSFYHMCYAISNLFFFYYN